MRLKGLVAVIHEYKFIFYFSSQETLQDFQASVLQVSDGPYDERWIF